MTKVSHAQTQLESIKGSQVDGIKDKKTAGKEKKLHLSMSRFYKAIHLLLNFYSFKFPYFFQRLPKQ